MSITGFRVLEREGSIITKNTAFDMLRKNENTESLYSLICNSSCHLCSIKYTLAFAGTVLQRYAYFLPSKLEEAIRHKARRQILDRNISKL